jgi:hypothetical protein
MDHLKSKYQGTHSKPTTGINAMTVAGDEFRAINDTSPLRKNIVVLKVLALKYDLI